MKKFFTNNKIIVGVIGLMAIVSVVNTQAIIKLSSRDISNSNQPAQVLNYQKSVNNLDKNESTSYNTNNVDLEMYLKQKYPNDYRERLNSITSNINKLINDSVNKDDPEEIRRFLCWLTGGTWVQVGSARTCLYFEESVSSISTNDTSWIEKAVISEKQFNEDYYSTIKKINYNISSEIESILASKGVDHEIQSISIRRFLCRLFGGTWTTGTVGATMDGPDYVVWDGPITGGVNINFSGCAY